VSTAPLLSEEPKLGDEPAQLRRLADATEARLRHAREEIEKATQALKKVQEVVIEQCQVVEQEKVSLQTNFE
jgi:hypothetical protein